MTKATLAQWGSNSRRLLHHGSALRARLRYLCDYLFDGDHHVMGAALGICYRQCYRYITGHCRLTVAAAAQIVSRLNVRAEWLLCGTGEPFIKDSDVETLSLPKTLSSSFQLFDAATYAPGAVAAEPLFPASPPNHTEDAPYIAAARAIYGAQTAGRSVGFFLGGDAFPATAAEAIKPFFDARYAQVLVATLSYAQHDVQRLLGLPVDLSSVVLAAATRGLGLAEAIGLLAFPAGSVRETSLLASLYDAGLATAVSVEIGELSYHVCAPVRGAEAGAALGAAAYVDLLILTEQMRNFFGPPGGVYVIAGETQRGARLFVQRYDALNADEPDRAGVTFAIFSEPAPQLAEYIAQVGGLPLFLGPPTTAAILRLFQSCADVYAGKIL